MLKTCLKSKSKTTKNYSTPINQLQLNLGTPNLNRPKDPKKKMPK